MRRLVRSALIPVVLAGALWLWGYRNARADPVVRRATLELANWPAGESPITVALLSDIHIGNATMDGDRLTRIVAQVNALKPDLVLLAGDFVAGHDRDQGRRFALGLTAPLAGLRAPLGTLAVLGNHDHWTDPIAVGGALEAAHVTVIDNVAVARGPLAVMGVGDTPTGHDSLAAALASLRTVRGVPLVVTHSPDLAPKLPATGAVLLAGHTHCGQVVLPGWGPISVPSIYGTRYLCGVIHERRSTVIVTGGVGTSVVPIRFGAPPDLWLLTIGP